MENVKSWAFSICCCVIVCGILYIILPEGNTKKIFKAVLCVFFLSVVIYPISEIDSNFLNFGRNDFDISFDYSESENMFNNISEEYLENEIIKSTEEILKSAEIVFKDISVKVNILENRSIDINDFTVIVYENSNTDGLAQKIIKKTGVEPKIIISGES